MSQISRNLTVSYENEVICEKNEEIREMRELQNQNESDTEYGQYADEEEIEEYIMNLKQIKIYKRTTLVANVLQGTLNGNLHKPVEIPYEIWNQVKIFNAAQNKSFQYGDWFFTKDWM